MTEIEERLLSIIGTGEENAVTQQRITSLIGLPPRETRLILERLRKSGIVICAGDKGRFFPQTVKELENYVLRVQASVRAQCIALAPAKRLLKEWSTNNHE